MTAPHKTAAAVANRHPAETTGGSLGVAGLIYAIADHNTTAAIVAAFALAPAAITTWIQAGGLRGIRHLLLNGSSRT